MSRLENVFKDRNHKALIAFLTSGYPSIEATLEIVPVLVEHGCDIIELGIPFSDPLADGVTLQNASYSALKAGITPGKCIKIAADIRKRVDTPIVFLTYYNPVLAMGLQKFCRESAAAGVDGLLIPDLPVNEAEEIDEIAVKEGLDIVYMIAPNSPDYRIEMIADKTRGFIYMVSLTGVTGARDSLPSDLEQFVERVKLKTNKPLCVGFGISTEKQATRVGRVADGVIIGSRLVQLLNEPDNHELLTWIDGIRKGLDTI
ncbi:MAG: tryptophan synthase subunit alpha [Dehalococcoidia bacterium]|nr:tryptophan synthase subunit alpha [Dehalococcoidia bacterium]